MLKRLIGVSLLVFSICVPMIASAQFGGLVKKSKYDTKKVDTLLKDIDAVVAQYEEATDRVWNSSEIVQNLVATYKAGEFPVLTKNWAVLKDAFGKVKDDAERSLLLKEKDLYRQQMGARAKAMEEFLQDPTRKADLKGKFTVPEKDQLKTVYGDLKAVPDKDKAIADQATALVGQIPALLADLGKQVTEDPLKAGDYKKLMDRLNKGTEKLTAIPTELGEQLKAVELLVSVLAGLVE